jgi:hypothetical protein
MSVTWLEVTYQTKESPLFAYLRLRIEPALLTRSCSANRVRGAVRGLVLRMPRMDRTPPLAIQLRLRRPLLNSQR